ncbi:class II aldolase/adducin family protein [Priestia filamentosa]|uniref:class II aldolase/adducin family protein n=1 Tax=Priestia filamentosa TaxID=1402861 RepID=UPI0039827B71
MNNTTYLKIPTFETAAEERRHRKERLVAAFRLFSKFGFDEGVAGHITVRDPEYTDHFWVNPYGKHFSQVRVSDLLLVNHKGEIVEGDQPLNGAAFAIHSEIHNARPDVVAAAHAHSVYGKTWSTLGRLLDPITQDACQFYNDHGLLTVGQSVDSAAWWFITMERSCQAQLMAEAAGNQFPLTKNTQC